jgi:hypothetical protein
MFARQYGVYQLAYKVLLSPYLLEARLLKTTSIGDLIRHYGQGHGFHSGAPEYGWVQ